MSDGKKLNNQLSEGEKNPWFIAIANFHSVNTAQWLIFSYQLMSLDTEVGRNMCNHLSQASMSTTLHLPPYPTNCSVFQRSPVSSYLPNSMGINGLFVVPGTLMSLYIYLSTVLASIKMLKPSAQRPPGTHLQQRKLKTMRHPGDVSVRALGRPSNKIEADVRWLGESGLVFV